MKCEACQTEITTDTCPKCGLKPTKQRCPDCSRKFNKSYLNHGLCPECLTIEKNAPYKDPFVALCLSVIPGAGFRYLGLKQKSGKVLSIFIISAITVILPVFVIMFSGIDAYITAKRMNVMDEV